MGRARYEWEGGWLAPGSHASSGPLDPSAAAGQPAGWVRKGHGTVLRGNTEIEAATAAMDAWESRHRGSGLSDKERDDLYSMAVAGEEFTFRPLVWFMAHYRSRTA